MDQTTKSIYEYMQEHGSITGRDAYLEFGTMRLAEYVSRIRKHGIMVYSVWNFATSKGRKVKFKRYSLEPLDKC